MTAASVSIVIPVYRRASWLLKNLAALEIQNFPGEFEIIVVDDGSPNHLEIQAVIEKTQMESDRAIRYFYQANAGPAGARNTGVRNAQGSIVCFLDDDSVPEADWLANIVEPFSRSRDVGLVSGRIRSFFSEEAFPVLLEKVIYKGKCWATCNIAYRKEAFERVGGFDESFPEPSWEDNDLGLRVRWEGFLHIHTDSAVVRHPHERDIEEYRQKCLLNGRGMAVFCRKYWRVKPLWGIGSPLVMARHLLWTFHPSVWRGQVLSAPYLRFTWSWYSLKGFSRGLMS